MTALDLGAVWAVTIVVTLMTACLPGVTMVEGGLWALLAGGGALVGSLVAALLLRQAWHRRRRHARPSDLAGPW